MTQVIVTIVICILIICLISSLFQNLFTPSVIYVNPSGLINGESYRNERFEPSDVALNWSTEKCKQRVRDNCQLTAENSNDLRLCYKDEIVPIGCRKQLNMGRPYVEDICENAVHLMKKIPGQNDYTMEKCVSDTNFNDGFTEQQKRIYNNCVVTRPSNLNEYIDCFIENL